MAAIVNQRSAERFRDLLAQPCFYCGGEMQAPAVCWFGMSGDIVLHPSCVLSLLVRLARDVHEIEVWQRICEERGDA